MLRMALLRARAGLQRQELEHSIRHIGSGGSGSWVTKALRLYQSYPYLVSSASGMLSGAMRGRHATLMRVFLVAVAAWQLVRSFKKP